MGRHRHGGRATRKRQQVDGRLVSKTFFFQRAADNQEDLHCARLGSLHIEGQTSECIFRGPLCSLRSETAALEVSMTQRPTANGRRRSMKAGRSRESHNLNLVEAVMSTSETTSASCTIWTTVLPRNWIRRAGIRCIDCFPSCCRCRWHEAAYSEHRGDLGSFA